ncbi:unnamed protein product [Prorocentrum cordatum]|uniref:Uncharacterized protein n=1 Tax=Prorocentrum cordatum TaxID=2364126 RepID=A0ABN9RPQ6_9DINO|nr:unnamed protein product [Polarella glacialis]
MASRCRICVATGVDGLAMPGADVCEAHQPYSTASEGFTTGLTQSLDELAMGNPAQTAAVAAPPGLGDSAATGGPLRAAGAPPAVPPLGRVIWLPSTFLSDLVETAILHHFDVIQAASMLNGGSVGLAPKDMQAGWDAVVSALRSLAFDPDAVDEWHCLGIIPASGPKPSELLIEQRYVIAATLVSLSSCSSWSEADKALADAFQERLEKAREACLAMLPGGLVCWAPSDASTLGRLRESYMQHAAEDPRPRTLRLLVPLDTLPGSSSATSILDLWTHPLLHDKWKPVIRSIEFTSQALEIVQSGAVAPTTSSRTLMIATVSASAPFVAPGVRSVALPLFDLARGRGIRVDCLVSDLIVVRRAMSVALAGRPVRWTEPMRSPGSTPTLTRVFFTGYFPVGAVSALDVKMLISILRNTHVPATTLLASEDVFSDSGAAILELTDPAAALSVVPLCDDMAFVTSKTLTLRTLTTVEVWQEKLESMFATDPACFASKLRWRRSRNGGRTIAQPEATQRQLQASRRMAMAPSPSDRSQQAEVVVHGSMGYDPRQVELQVIQVLASNGVVLREGVATSTSTAGFWYSGAAPASSGAGGRLRLHLTSTEELGKVRDALHDKAFQLGSEMVSLTVSDDASLAEQAKNGRRGVRRQAAPPSADGAA